ncbi:hypothetical protein E2562_022575, partial [Oryza meyeriana var. granulata]
ICETSAQAEANGKEGEDELVLLPTNESSDCLLFILHIVCFPAFPFQPSSSPPIMNLRPRRHGSSLCNLDSAASLRNLLSLLQSFQQGDGA